MICIDRVLWQAQRLQRYCLLLSEGLCISSTISLLYVCMYHTVHAARMACSLYVHVIQAVCISTWSPVRLVMTAFGPKARVGKKKRVMLSGWVQTHMHPPSALHGQTRSIALQGICGSACFSFQSCQFSGGFELQKEEAGMKIERGLSASLKPHSTLLIYAVHLRRGLQRSNKKKKKTLKMQICLRWQIKYR